MTLELNNQWFLRVTIGGSDGRRRELGLSEEMLQDIQITSSIDQIIPTFKMVYKQNIPAFQDDEPVVSPVPARVSIGQTSTNKSETEKYHFTVQRPHEASKGNSRRPILIIRGFGSSIMKLTESQNRAFQSLEDGVKTISSDVGAPVSESDFTGLATGVNNKTYIQPRFSNAKMLRFFQKKAVATGNWSHYRYWIDRESNGHFQTINDLLGQPTEQTLTHSSTDNPSGRAIVSDFDWILDSRHSLRNGGFGIQSHRWNWEDGSYERSEFGPEQSWTASGHPKVADESLIKSRESLTNKQPQSALRGKQEDVGESSIRAEAEAKSRPIDEMLNMQGIKLAIRGRMDADPGDMVELVITDPSMTGQKQQVPSGRWLVHTKTEGIQNEIITRAILVRDGHNRRRS